MPVGSTFSSALAAPELLLSKLPLLRAQFGAFASAPGDGLCTPGEVNRCPGESLLTLWGESSGADAALRGDWRERVGVVAPLYDLRAGENCLIDRGDGGMTGGRFTGGESTTGGVIVKVGGVRVTTFGASEVGGAVGAGSGAEAGVPQDFRPSAAASPAPSAAAVTWDSSCEEDHEEERSGRRQSLFFS